MIYQVKYMVIKHSQWSFILDQLDEVVGFEKVAIRCTECYNKNIGCVHFGMRGDNFKLAKII